MNSKNLILLSYGNKTEYNRTIFCVLSFWAHYTGNTEKIRIIIYTDNKDYFEPFFNKIEVSYVTLTPEILQDMLAGSTYIHRRKVAVIDLTLKQHPGEDLIFVDSDTFFTKNPQPWIAALKPDMSYMHLKEYTFQEGLALFSSFNQSKEPKAFIDFLESQPVKIGGEDRSFNRNDFCWNSGVLGLTSDLSVYIDDVFVMTDDFFKNSSWFISEQLAFSLLLQDKTKVLPSDEYVYHYWGKRQKRLMDGVLEKVINDLPAETKTNIVKLTIRLESKIADDVIKERAVLALFTKNWGYAVKRIFAALLKNPANISLFREWSEMKKSSVPEHN
ncbi:hypothetical protein [Pedobacter frigoris]|uniref:Nucleotide-diphospho-sugar transferase domain-containing protein n=1 Tax=Pedobacter frigoris TaxID=2571272 RepID=A0A4U1CU74_9SPHI|nr:hypothetical protein [Pedobacter frigoris]TKC09328.1 hypothetical protein FA047_04340 [Pedobacter frigoris]